MLRGSYVVPIFLLLALTGDVVYSQAQVCKKTGFFGHFLQEWMKLSGTCSRNYEFAYFGMGPGGLFIVFLGNNQNISMDLKNDNTAKANNVDLGRGPNNTVTANVKKGGKVQIAVSGPNSCKATGKIKRLCKYTVQTTDCVGIRRGDKICGPCETPCPDYGDDSIPIFLQGKPHPEDCTASLRRANRNCIACSGKHFSPKDE